MTIPAEARYPAGTAPIARPSAASRRQSTIFDALAYGSAYAWIETSRGSRGGGRSGAVGGVDDQLPDVGARARPPRARGGDPEQVVVQLAIAGRAGLLGDGDQIGHPCAIRQRAGIQQLADEARSRDVQRLE